MTQLDTYSEIVTRRAARKLGKLLGLVLWPQYLSEFRARAFFLHATHLQACSSLEYEACRGVPVPAVT